MNYRVVVQPPATADIDAAYIYLRDRSHEAADRWLAGLERAIQTLQTLPHRHGRARENAEFGEDIRQMLYGRRSGRYRVLFVVRGNAVHVLHVRHGARKNLPPEELRLD